MLLEFQLFIHAQERQFCFVLFFVRERMLLAGSACMRDFLEESLQWHTFFVLAGKGFKFCVSACLGNLGLHSSCYGSLFAGSWTGFVLTGNIRYLPVTISIFRNKYQQSVWLLFFWPILKKIKKIKAAQRETETESKSIGKIYRKDH